MISLDRQIKSVEREIVLRKRVYPRLVGQEKMKPETAKEEIEAMEAVLENLKGQLEMF